jgi:tRNA pseudouridine38-40 synthase
MVRIATGTLLWAGEKGLNAQDIKEIILSGDRSKAGPTAPPYGLYLNRVFYDGIES